MFVGSLWLVLAIFVTLGFIMWRRWPKRVPILAADGSGKRLTTDSSADLSAGYSLFAGTVVQVKNPSLAREVLVEKADNFVRWIPFVPKGGLFTSEGDEYKRHHKVLSSAMRRDFITSLNSVIDRTAEDLIVTIQKNQSSSGSIDDTFELIFKQVSKSILTLTYGDTPLARELVAASAEMFGRDLSSLATLLPTGLAKCVPIPSVQKRVNNAQTARRYYTATHYTTHRSTTFSFQRLQQVVLNTIRGKESQEDQDAYKETLLSMLEQANVSAGSILTDYEILSNAVGFGVGGNDSTSSGLTSLIYLLGKHPQVQTKLRNLRKAEGKEDEYQSFLHAVVREAHRLHPPFTTALTRYAQEDDQLGGYIIPKGVGVTVDILALNRDERNWGNATTFDPERYNSVNNTTSHNKDSRTSFTFGMGKRMCIGMRVARSLTHRWAEELVDKFNIVAPQEDVEFDASFGGVMKPKKPLRMIFQPLAVGKGH